MSQPKTLTKKQEKTAKWMVASCDGEMVDSRVCSYCGKRKRGWRKVDVGTLCARCDKEVYGL
jgi:hypothetical protein